MSSRRLVYGALLLGTAILHLAYGQYVTFYILLFVLFLPILSLLISLPAVFMSRAELIGGADVRRGREATVRLRVACRFFLPPEVWKLKIEQQNLFLDARAVRTKVRLFGAQEREETFTPDTAHLGTVVYRIRSARVCDYLGIFALPVKKGAPAALTVLPNTEEPMPVPELVEPSDRVLKPKPLGFSEEHELRPYREGDAVNLIHWKLTEKMDAPIVREPQELIRKNIVLCMDLSEDYASQQSALEQLRFLSDLLLENRIPYLLYYGLHNIVIGGSGDFDRFLKAFLSSPIRNEQAQHIVAGSDTLVYRIVPKKEERK